MHLSLFYAINMDRLRALKTLHQWDKAGKYVFTSHELHKIFYPDNYKACVEGINRLVKNNILLRACRGVYVNPDANSSNGYTIEYIAKALRYGEYNYVSLESMLSEYGLISQIPIDRLTVMTTGRKGIYKTIFGVIEFTHTKRSMEDIISRVKQVDNRPLRIASAETAFRDLKRVGRNVYMVDLEKLHDNPEE